MADFDQLIKDKVEQAKYPYKHSAWKSFASRAGIKAGLSGLQIAAIVLSAVVVVTGVTLGILFLGHPTTNRDQGTVVRVQDTVETQQDADPSQNVQGAVDSVQGKEDVQKPVSISTHKDQRPKTKDQQPISNIQSSTSSTSKPTSKPRRPVYGPPLEINVDTITQMEPTDEQLRQGNSRIF